MKFLQYCIVNIPMDVFTADYDRNFPVSAAVYAPEPASELLRGGCPPEHAPEQARVLALSVRQG
jgi:hypothetical protein